MASIRLGSRKFSVPGSPTGRRVTGALLIGGGALGFLPVFGFWMLPLGVAVLSVDSHRIRRRRRLAEVWWGRRRQRSGQATPDTSGRASAKGNPLSSTSTTRTS
jgi:hypothetical protein